MDWDAITPQLKGKLDPKNVKQPPKGKYGEYIEGWHAIAEANAIFGFGAWSYRIDSLEEAARELVWLEGKSGEKYQQWRVCHVCQVTVTVGDASRQDVGTGQGQAKPNALGDAIDSSAKEAVTDALKRSLRSFGNRFGLALYDKTKANVGVDDPEDHLASAPIPDPKLSERAAAHGPSHGSRLPTPIDLFIGKMDKAVSHQELAEIWSSHRELQRDGGAIAAKDRNKARLAAPPERWPGDAAQRPDEADCPF